MASVLLLIIIYITFISLGLPDSILGSLFPAIATNLNLSSDLAGYIGLVISLCTIISSLLSSYLIKKFTTKYVIAFSVLLTAVGLALFSLVTSSYYWAFFLIAIPLGLGAGAIDAALNNYVALHYKAIHMNWLHASWGLGASIGPLIVSSFIDVNNNSSNWDKGVLVISLIQFSICLLIFCTLKLWNKSAEKINENQDEKKRVYKLNNIFKNPIFYCAVIGFFCYCALETSAGLWVGNFFHKGLNLNTEQAARLTSTFYIGITLGRFLSGPISLKLKEKWMIRLGEIILTLGLILIFIQVNIYVVITGFIIIGLGCAPLYPAIIRSTPYRFSKEASQQMMGLEMATAYIGNLTMAPLIGLIARLNNDNYLILPYFLVLFAIIMIISHEIINYKLAKRDKTLSQDELKNYIND